MKKHAEKTACFLLNAKYFSLIGKKFIQEVAFFTVNVYNKRE